MSVEEIEEGLYKILHKDYMNFQNQLEKASQNSNFVYEKDFKEIIENIIGYSMNKEQWKELKGQFDYVNPAGDEDNEDLQRLVNFRKFLEKFNKPPTNVKNRKRIINKDFYDIPRNNSVLCRMVADKLRFRFHAIDKVYKSFEIKHQQTLTRELLFELLNSQGCNLTDMEMSVIWKVIEENPNHSSWHYRQILKHLMFNLYKKADEMSIEQRKFIAEDPNIDVLKEFKMQNKDEKSKMDQQYNRKIEEALKVKPFIVDTSKGLKTIENMSSLMTTIWVAFKKQLRKVDICGTTKIELLEMKDLLIKNGFVIPNDEMENLLYMFDINKNGRFHYIDFLTNFAKFYPNEGIVKPNLHFDRIRHQLFNQLLKQWKSLIRAFRKIDTNKTGKLDMNQLNKVILNAGIRLSKDDLYHVFSGFDKNLDGKIDYVEFIEQLLDVFVPNPTKPCMNLTLPNQQI